MPQPPHLPIEIGQWFSRIGFRPFAFQQEVWQSMMEGKSGLLNAPTGSGKTLAIWLGALARLWPRAGVEKKAGLKVLWITPLRSLSKDTHKALQQAAEELGLGWKVELRTGDTPASQRTRQKKNPPDCLIITPESLHLLISQKENNHWFKHVQIAIVDEWHDLLGTKRGVQVELAFSRIRSLVGPDFMVWGISATLPDLPQACHVLVGQLFTEHPDRCRIIRAELKKKINIRTLFPASIDRFPWGGRMGLPMLQEILEVIEQSKSTLVFTNTRAQTEVWYQNLLLYGNDLAGNIAIHHSSLDLEIRRWVEDALKENRLKVVVCTSSLDLGVDFAPVETIIQIGSPKDVSRILQRAGRSGHGPGRESNVYFVPTHSLELIDASAIQYAVSHLLIEGKSLIQKPLDVLIQWMVTLAVGDGLYPEQTFTEVKQTYTYRHLSEDEWDWAMYFITRGGQSFAAYDDFVKVMPAEDGAYRVINQRTALRHRLSMGTIVSDVSLKVRFLSGGYIGTVEENFFARLKTGDVFWFGGRPLEIVRLTASEVLVKKATKGKGTIPAWSGGRMPLSSTFADILRLKVNQLAENKDIDAELMALQPLVEIQKAWSAMPRHNEFLVEYFKSRDGWHWCFYPFEGRYIHEILASLVAFRIASTLPISFSIGMNDYGFELLTNVELNVEELLGMNLFSVDGLETDLKQSINEGEMARRKFREIASISGMVFQGFPGKEQPARHLRASAQLIYDVLVQYEPDHLLLAQAHNEVLDFTSENSRLVETLNRINSQRIVLQFSPRPTPLAFPILVDSIRARLTSENIEEQVERLVKQLEEFAAGKKQGSRRMEHSRKKEGRE